MIEIRFDKTKDEVALLIWFLVDHSVYTRISSSDDNVFLYKVSIKERISPYNSIFKTCH
jgi:hypothetical protein